MNITKIKRDLCIMACLFCKDPLFLKWLDELCTQAGYEVDAPADESFAKTFILIACNIQSRNDLDTDTEAAARFHECVRTPFLDWKEARA